MRPGWVIGLLILAAIVLAYANSFPGAFYFDDEDAITRNESIRHLTDLRHVLWPPLEAGIGGRPFANLTFALNFAWSGFNAWSYHLVNLLIHAATAVLLFLVTRRTLRLPGMRARFGEVATGVALVAALLWGLHPLGANIVDYMSQRTEGLMSGLYLLTLYAFVRSVEESSQGWGVTAFVACLLGMATKEGMVTAPALVFLYDRTFIAGSFRDAFQRRWRRHAALAATWLLLAGLMLTSKLSERGVGFGLGHSGYEYALTECRSIVRYLQLALWPYPLVFDYGPLYLHNLGEALPTAALLLAVIAGTVYAVWRAPAVGFLGAWFFIVLSPSSSVIPVVQQPCAENRPYLAFAAVMVLLATLAYRAAGRRAVTIGAIVAGALGVATYARNPVFANETAVWADTVLHRPENARAHNNLGNALLKNGHVEESKPQFEAAIQLTPNYADARNNLGVVLLREGHPQEALEQFQRAIKDKEKYADAYYNCGEAYLQLGRPADAIGTLQESLKLNPNNPKARNNLGIALLDTGRVQESIDEEHTALRLQPTMPEAHYNLGNSLARAGKNDEALAEYDETLRLDANFAKAHNNAGVILLNRGQLAQAAARFEAALKINPSYPEAQRNLQVVRQRLGK